MLFAVGSKIRIALVAVMFVPGCSSDEQSTELSSTADTGDEPTNELEIPPDSYCLHNDEFVLTESTGTDFFENNNLHRLAGCRVIRGDLRVFAETTLEPLAALEEVDSLEVWGSLALSQDLGGLERLHTVHHKLEVRGARDRFELPSLQNVGELILYQNDNLEEIRLPSLRHVDSVVLQTLPALISVGVGDGVIAHAVSVSGCPMLAIDANLRVLLHSASSLELWGTTLPDGYLSDAVRLESFTLGGSHNQDLSALSGLRSLTSLELSANPQMTSLAGLEVPGGEMDRLQLWNNPALRDISALASVGSIGEAAFHAIDPGVLAQLHELRSAELFDVSGSSGGPLAWPPLTHVGTISILGNTMENLGRPLQDVVVGDVIIANNYGFTDEDAYTWLDALDVFGDILISDNVE